MSLIYLNMDTEKFEYDFLVTHCKRLQQKVAELESQLQNTRTQGRGQRGGEVSMIKHFSDDFHYGLPPLDKVAELKHKVKLLEEKIRLAAIPLNLALLNQGHSKYAQLQRVTRALDHLKA